MRNHHQRILRAVLIALLTACSAPERQPARPSVVRQELPADVYLDPAVKSDVYRFETDRSHAEILVHRAGRLQRLGHDHVILAPRIAGYAMVDPKQPRDARADLAIDLTALVVDTPELRAAYQLDTHPSETDISKTTTNMSTRVLETATWPQALVHVSGIESLEGETRCETSLTLKGVTKTFPATVIIHRDEGVLTVQGKFDLNQSDFGIEPFSVLGGALSVEDRVEISYRLEATKLR